MAARDGAPSALMGWWTVTVLFLAYMLSYVDRTIIALLVEPLRADLGLSDIEISVLQGLAFAVFYTTLSVPIAVLADRYSRRLIIGIGVLFWSLMTSVCGLAQNFWHLLLARMGVGIGEATLSPAAFSLIGDLFPEEKRGRAMAIFSSGVSVGGGLALIIGGAIIAFATNVGEMQTLIGELRAWQLVFLLLGPPGVLVALLMFTVPEPRGRAAAQAESPPPILPFLLTKWRVVAPLFVGMAITGMIQTAMLYWAPSFLIRAHGLSPPEAGQMLGFGLLFAGPLGAFAGGALSDHWSKKGLPDGPVRAGALSALIMAVAGFAAPFAPTPLLAGVLFVIAFFFGGAAYPAGAAAVQRLSETALRARVAAVYLLVVTLVASAIGPTMVAMFTEVVFKDPAAVGVSLAATIAITAPLALAALALASGGFRRMAQV